MQLATGVVVHATYTSFDPLHSVILPGLCMFGLLICVSIMSMIADAQASMDPDKEPTITDYALTTVLLLILSLIVATLFALGINPEHHLAPTQESISSSNSVADHYKISNIYDYGKHCIDHPLGKPGTESFSCNIEFNRSTDNGGDTQYTGVAQYNASNKTVTIYQRTAKGTLKEYRQQ